MEERYENPTKETDARHYIRLCEDAWAENARKLNGVIKTLFLVAGWLWVLALLVGVTFG